MRKTQVTIEFSSRKDTKDTATIRIIKDHMQEGDSRRVFDAFNALSSVSSGAWELKEGKYVFIMWRSPLNPRAFEIDVCNTANRLFKVKSAK